MPLTEQDIEHIITVVKAQLFNSDQGWVSHEEFAAYCLRVERMFYGLYGILGALLLLGAATLLSKL